LKIIFKAFDDIKRSMYMVVPDGEPRTAFKNTFITILRDDASEESVKQIIADCGLEAYVERNRFILGFMNPVGGGWNFGLDPFKKDDMSDIKKMQSVFTSPFTNGGWHPMNDAKYFIGIGSGSSMVGSFVSNEPADVAAILTIGGKLDKAALAGAKNAATPAMMVGSDQSLLDYFAAGCGAELESNDGVRAVYRSKINPAAQIITYKSDADKLTADIVAKMWTELFSRTRRPNTSVVGDPETRLVLSDYHFEYHLDDPCLGDNNNLPHTWFEHIPQSVLDNPGKKVPLLLFSHGGSDNPEEAADMSRWYMIGEREGFISVYTWGSDKNGWNFDFTDDKPSDEAFYLALIDYLVKKYAIDTTRIYLSGFSMGSAFMQAFALAHPDLIAAIAPHNTRWCQARESKPFMLSAVKKLQYDYRMPVWYTYGTRDMEYPVVRGSGQQVQYDFWKFFNNITVRPTGYGDHADPSGCGVPGQKIEVIYPSATHPDHKYTVNRFFTNDPEPKNYYNYVLHHGKGHEVAPEDSELGWQYISRFSRNPDGSLNELPAKPLPNVKPPIRGPFGPMQP